MDRWRSAAARNNAEWCDIVARSHGARTRFDDDAWTSATRTPQFYPDAVSLVPDVSVPDLLARIDASPGCSIKDSFASLDLTAHGFRVLFDAQWIVRPSAPPASTGSAPHWERVRDAGEVVLVAERKGDEVLAGAVLNRSADVVGVSNFFTAADVAASWSGLLACAGWLFPGVTLVGYESGADLAFAQHAGFDIAGELRVWIAD